MMKSILILAVSTLALAQQQQQEQSIWQIINNIAQGGQGGNQQQGDLSIFRDQVEQFPQLRDVMAGNSTTYQGQQVPSQITVVAPINYAFRQLPRELQELLQQRAQASQQGRLGRLDARQIRGPILNQVVGGLLSYHVMQQVVNTSMFIGQEDSVKTLLQPFNASFYRVSQNFQNDLMSKINNQQTINAAQAPQIAILPGSSVNDANITLGFQASNGILYLIDDVISPLWYLNVSLATVGQAGVPDLVRIMGF